MMRCDKEGVWFTWDEWKAHQLEVAFTTGKEGMERRRREEQNQIEQERLNAARLRDEMRRMNTRQGRMDG